MIAVENRPDGVRVGVETPDGPYHLCAEWLLACDGAHSTVRRSLGLDFVGRVFHDRFLIADVVMQAEFPTERWFWFDPPFHPGQSVLLHKQPDNVWRIDFQLGRDADPEQEKAARARHPAGAGDARARRRNSRSNGSASTRFRCRRMERFVHGRTIFLGDAAHQVSPFGARGGNGGVQDADNLGWKLAAVLRGEADAALIASYDAERIPGDRREHPALDPQHRFHHAENRRRARLSRRRAAARRALRLRAPAGQFRPPLPPRRARGLAAEHAG